MSTEFKKLVDTKIYLSAPPFNPNNKSTNIRVSGNNMTAGDGRGWSDSIA